MIEIHSLEGLRKYAEQLKRIDLYVAIQESPDGFVVGVDFGYEYSKKCRIMDAVRPHRFFNSLMDLIDRSKIQTVFFDWGRESLDAERLIVDRFISKQKEVRNVTA